MSADATVMTGLTGGVPTLFKNEQPCLQAIHCYAHRLELAYKDALKKLTLYGTSSNPLLNLYLSYHHSPLNRSNLKTTFQTLSLPLVLSKLSLVAQTKAATVADVHASFTSVSWLHKHKAKPTPKEHSLSLSLSLNMDEVPTFHGDQLSGPGFAAETRSRMLDSIIISLQGHFDRGSAVVKAATIASFKLWPPKEEMDDFGDEVATLTCHFKPVLLQAGVDMEQVETEWSLLKTRLYERSKNEQELMWIQVNSSSKEDFPNILSLVDLILTLPDSSADAERIQSVKTDKAENPLQA